MSKPRAMAKVRYQVVVTEIWEGVLDVPLTQEEIDMDNGRFGSRLSEHVLNEWDDGSGDMIDATSMVSRLTVEDMTDLESKDVANPGSEDVITTHWIDGTVTTRPVIPDTESDDGAKDEEGQDEWLDPIDDHITIRAIQAIRMMMHTAESGTTLDELREKIVTEGNLFFVSHDDADAFRIASVAPSQGEVEFHEREKRESTMKVRVHFTKTEYGSIDLDLHGLSDDEAELEITRMMDRVAAGFESLDDYIDPENSGYDIEYWERVEDDD